MIPIIINTYIDNPQMYTERARKAAYKAFYAAFGTLWANWYLPKHFERGNTDRYQFAPRNAKYLQRKKRLAAINPAVYKQGGEVDLVFLGRLKRTAIASARQNIKPYFNRVTIRMEVPQIAGWKEDNAIDPRTGRRRPRYYATPRKQNGYGPNMPKEMKAVTFNELREMKGVGLRAMNGVLQKRYGKYLYRPKSGARAA
jgi:hypothetical protein